MQLDLISQLTSNHLKAGDLFSNVPAVPQLDPTDRGALTADPHELLLRSPVNAV